MKNPQALKVGFIGLGHMGLAMAKRLIEAGYNLTVYNRTEAKTKSLVALGAKVAHYPTELNDTDFIITMLTDDKAVNDVVFGPQGFSQTMKKGATHIAMSTISIDLSRELAAKHEAAGQHYVAAPVLGRPDAAEAGKLYIFAAGEKAKECETLFAAMGQRTFGIQGEVWKAHLVKLACNFMLVSAVQSMSEAFAFTRKAGINPQDFLEIFSTTLFDAPVYKNYGKIIASQNYDKDVGFKITIGAKDINLVLAAGEEMKVPMPTASLIHDRMVQAIAQGNADLDWSALGKIAAEAAGLK